MKMNLPYKSGKVTLTSHFGWRTLNGQRDYHKGVDLSGTDKKVERYYKCMCVRNSCSSVRIARVTLP